MTPTRTAAAMRAAPQIRKKLIDSFLTRDETIAAIIDAELAEERAERDALREALGLAVTTIGVWHGKNGWREYYQESPEMRQINATLAQCHESRKA